MQNTAKYLLNFRKDYVFYKRLSLWNIHINIVNIFVLQYLWEMFY